MSIPYVESGRVRQKARTRAAMLDAARELLAEGVTPTVEQVAERAGVSRSTAFRYFPNQRSVLVSTYPELDRPRLLDADSSSDPVERLEVVTEQIGRQLLDHEPELRAMLRLSLETPPPAPEELPLRSGKALEWIEDALAPLEGSLSRKDVRRLALAIRATLGIEPFVWLTGVGGLSGDAAVRLMRDSARALLRDALRDERA